MSTKKVEVKKEQKVVAAKLLPINERAKGVTVPREGTLTTAVGADRTKIAGHPQLEEVFDKVHEAGRTGMPISKWRGQYAFFLVRCLIKMKLLEAAASEPPKKSATKVTKAPAKKAPAKAKSAKPTNGQSTPQAKAA